MVSRSPRSRMNGKRMPIPRSNPSITTYIINPKPMITAQMTGRSMPIALSPPAARPHDHRIDAVGDRGQRTRRTSTLWIWLGRMIVVGLRAFRCQLEHVADPSSEDGHIHHTEH